MHRATRYALGLALLVAAAGPATAGNLESCVAEIRRALAADDDDALSRAAERWSLHAWTAAVDLVAAGETPGALRFARACRCARDEKLAEHVTVLSAWEGDWSRVAPLRKLLREATVAAAQGDPDRALEILDELEIPEGYPPTLTVREAFARVLAHTARQEWEEVVTAARASAEAAAGIGWRDRARVSWEYAVGAAFYRGDKAAALECAEHLRDAARASGDAGHLARAESQVGSLLVQRGRSTAAVPVLERACRLIEKIGDGGELLRFRLVLLQARVGAGQYRPAVLAADEFLAELPRGEHDPRRVEALVAQATALSRLGRLDEAEETLDEAIRLATAAKDAAAASQARLARAALLRLRGDAAAALTELERARDAARAAVNPALIGHTASMLGAWLAMLGRHEEARAACREAERFLGFAGDAVGRATSLSVRAHMALAEEETGEALELFRAALALCEQAKHVPGTAANLGSIAELSPDDEALALLTRSRDLWATIDDLPGAALAEVALARRLGRAGRHDDATKALERAETRAFEIEATEVRLRIAEGRAELLLLEGKAKEAVASARLAVGLLPQLVRGHGDEEGVGLRESYSDLYETALEAAVLADSAEDALFFIEAGRAGALLESFGGRDALASALLSPDDYRGLKSAEARLRRAELAIGEARRSGRRAGREERNEIDAAQRELRDRLRRLERKERNAASFAYPGAVDWETLAALLGDGDALVLFGNAAGGVWAYVQTTRTASLQFVSKTEELVAALGELDLTGPPAAETPAGPRRDPLREMRRAIIDPLALPAGTKRLFVSPSDALYRVPLPALVSEMDVVLIPSATVWVEIAATDASRGTGILALGAPDYPAGDRLRPPLPATGKEAHVVGDEVLTGRAATIEGFQNALARRERWRAIHLACHGLIDPREPMYSALALTSTEGDEGLLDGYRILRLAFAADLVTLSACDTARGKAYRSEGVMSLARSFLSAGAPRVIASLWRVDDRATRLLMEEFYRRWNSESGEGLPAPAALRMAQARVRATPGFERPRFWAAWTLWGRGD